MGLLSIRNEDVMIKIIKEGTKRKAMCEECGCVFSFEAEDVKKAESNGFGGYKEIVDCPQCHNSCIVRATR